MATKADVERLAEQGDIDGLLDLSDEFNAVGDLKGKMYCLEKIAGMTDKQTDPTKLNKCLYAMRNLGIMLANIGNEDADMPGHELIDPQRAFNLYQKILSEYPNERQAMFTRCELGQMYYNESYKKYGVPHDPDKGIELMKKWEDECARAQGLNTVPVLCFGVGKTIFCGRYSVSKKDQFGGLAAYSSKDWEYAKRILKEIGNDAGPCYKAAQEMLESIERYLPSIREVEAKM